MTWAAAMLASTSRIQILSTVHVPAFNPVVAAKMGASLDHIGNGRWGINIVSGWNRAALTPSPPWGRGQGRGGAV